MNALLLGVVADTLKSIFTIIPKLLYFIVSCILSLIDLCQMAFRKMAGLDSVTISGESYTGDSVYKIITDALFTGRYPAIKTIFWSLIILGVFMLFITSLIALIRIEYNPDKEKGNSKAGIVKNFFKAIFSFAIVPIACIFGMFLFNSLVGVVNTITTQPVLNSTEVTTYYSQWNAVADSNKDSGVYDEGTLDKVENAYMAYEVFGLHIPTNVQPFSGMVFRACAYGSNRVRNNEDYFLVLKNNNVLGFLDKFNEQGDAADIIDTGFAINAKLRETSNLSKDIVKTFYGDCSDFINFGTWRYHSIESLSKYNVNAVYFFYDLWSFNYIVAFVAVVSIGKLYFGFVLYLMQRLFEIIGLFLVSPISISLMPLDNGDSLKTWRTLFITKFTLLVIMVGTLNLISPLLAICNNIQFFNIPFIDYILTTFFLIAAFNAVDSLNKMFAKIFTGDDKNYGAVGEAAGAITKNFTTGANATFSAAKLAALPVTAPTRLGAHIIGGKIAQARKNKINQKIENAKNAYATEEQKLDAIDEATSKEDSANTAELAGIDADQATLNQFNNDTGGLLERNAANDTAMQEAYIKSHFVGKTKAQRDAFRTQLSTDAGLRQRVLDEMYDKDTAGKIDSFYKYDRNLSAAENAQKKADMLAMLQRGQSDITARRTANATERARIDTDIANNKTNRESRLEAATRRRDEEIRRLEESKTSSAVGRAAKYASGGIVKTAKNISNIAKVLPLSNEIDGILSANKYTDKPPK
ncbi:MAG: hypothetical protein MR904_00305 [Clostridia bacterium]|nr:hypothetical protein [Clostridia bacterium]